MRRPLYALMATERGFDRIMDAMGHGCRRRLLFALQERGPLDDDGLEAIEPEHPPAADGGTGSTMQAMLYHTHLPKLEGMGYVRRDAAAGTVSKGPEWDEIAPFVRLFRDNGDDLPVECP